ncbi:MAG: hypothetical protein ABIL09_00510 [Gemmatimonadota bacterium]
MYRALGTMLWCVLVALSVLAGRGEARSTVVVETIDATVAGPGLDQEIVLVLHCFPGDGEAVVAVEVGLPPASLQITGGASARGRVGLSAGGLRVDYGGRPLAAVAVDTVRLQGRTGQLGEASGAVRLFSSAGPEVAHQVGLPFSVVPPLGVAARERPTRLLPGQEAQVEVDLQNSDAQGRAVAAVAWKWPAEVEPLAGRQAGNLEQELPSGAQATLVYRLRVDHDALPGVLVVKGTARGAGLSASPLPDLELRIGASPEVELVAPHPGAAVGEAVTVGYAWRNPGAEPMVLAGIAIDVPDGFREAAAALGTREFAVSADGRRLQLDGDQVLSPGAEARAELSGVPERSGPAQFAGWYRIGDDGAWLPARGEPLLAVSHRLASDSTTERPEPTDLQAVSQALEQALSGAVASLPAAAGASLELVAEDPAQARNWVVEDALQAALLEAGYRLPQAGGTEGADSRLHYRLLTSRVVYTPFRGGWNPFAAGYRREVTAAVVLRLEGPDGRIVWTRRLEGGGSDRVSTEAAGWLGGSKGVERVELDPDFRVVEVGLSSLIAGGLVVVFFAP